ncbi:hypothetical protein [Spirillospora sp. NPDC047279]|uniref:hypothetical protein n=1 Tax=Spirillospora sp. NPDC047279 TaxID=3155478 RepID=UPI0033CAD743
MSQAGTALDVGELICVSKPYYALRDLVTTGPGMVEATVPVERPPGREATPITMAELGRHLAILGLCGAATVNPVAGRHFYLAGDAMVEWLAPPTSERPSELHGRATTAFTSRRRTARAHTELLDASGAVLAQVRIDYTVISERTFEHLFPADPPLVPTQVNPYRGDLPFPEVEVIDGRVEADLLVEPDMCVGHFTDRPMLPVAVAAGGLATIGERLLRERAGTDDFTWSSTRMALQAQRLVRAGTKVTFVAKADPENEDRYLGEVLSDGEVVASGQMDAVIH